MKKMLAIILALSMIFALCACSNSNEDSADPSVSDESGKTTAQEKTSVTIALTAGSFDLSPFGADGGPRDQTVAPLYGRLAAMPYFGASYEDMVGDMAKTMTRSEDGLTVTVELYDYIHDNRGNAITASDVVFCYNYATGLSGRNDFTRVNNYMESIEAIDDYTVKIVANGTGVGVIETILAAIPIVDQEWFESASDEEKISNPACTGSYYITDLVTDASIEMTKVEDYWQEDESLRTYLHMQPVDQIKYVVITEASMRTIALENGEVDVAQVTATEATRFIDENNNPMEGWSAYVFPSSRFNALMFNCDPTNGLFANNKELRQAICYAIDAGEVMLGAGDTTLTGTVAKDFGSSMAGNYIEDWKTEDYYEYDFAKAQQLFEASGYKAGELKLRLMISNAASRQGMATVIQARLAELGIDVEITSYDNALWSTYKTDFTQWDILIDSYSTTGYCSDAWNRLDHGDRNGVQDDHLQKLYEDSMNIADEASLNAFHDYLKEQAYAYGLYETNSVYIGQAGITGWRTGRTANIEAAAFTYADDYQTVVAD